MARNITLTIGITVTQVNAPAAVQGTATVVAVGTVTSATTKFGAAVIAGAGHVTAVATVSSPTTQTVVYGSSAGRVVADTETLLSPAIWRVYAQTPTTWASSGDAHLIPGGGPMVLSFKMDVPTLATGSGSAYSTAINGNLSCLNGLPDIPGQRILNHHEPVGDGFTAAVWAQSCINYQTDVVDVLNQTRTHKVKHCPIMNGFPAAEQQMSQYFPPSLVNVVDELGIDCYGFEAAAQQPPNDQVKKFHDWWKINAMPKGVTWGIGEIGYQTGAFSTDDQMLSVINYVVQLFASWPEPERPRWMAWFTGAPYDNEFNGPTSGTGPTPKCVAAYKPLCVASPAFS